MICSSNKKSVGSEIKVNIQQVYGCIYGFYSQVLLHLSVVSFQCPTDYQEDMGRHVESPGGEQNAIPTKRSLINLHKKVIVNITALRFLMETMQKYDPADRTCVSGHLCSAQTRSDSGPVVYPDRRGFSSRGCSQKPEQPGPTVDPQLPLSTPPRLDPQVLLHSYCR